MYLRVDALVGGVIHKDGVQRHFVEDRKHGAWRVCQKVGEDWLGQCEVHIRNLE